MTQNKVTSRRLPRRPKKLTGKKPIRVNTHLPVELVARVDRYAANLAEADALGRPVTRTDALRILIADGLKRAGIE